MTEMPFVFNNEISKSYFMTITSECNIDINMFIFIYYIKCLSSDAKYKRFVYTKCLNSKLPFIKQ